MNDKIRQIVSILDESYDSPLLLPSCNGGSTRWLGHESAGPQHRMAPQSAQIRSWRWLSFWMLRLTFDFLGNDFSAHFDLMTITLSMRCTNSIIIFLMAGSKTMILLSLSHYLVVHKIIIISYITGAHTNRDRQQAHNFHFTMHVQI